MKKILIFIALSLSAFASPSYTGLTGGIDFPNAYILIDRNYTISGIIGTLDGEMQGDLVIETNLIPQIEAGIKVSTTKKEFDNSFLQSNFKFQLVGETQNNPAIALGYTEFDEYTIQSDRKKEKADENADAYGFIVASKRIKLTEGSLNASVGAMFSKPKEGSSIDMFGSLEIPLGEAIKMTTELYSFKEDNAKKLSGNIGFDFMTTEKFRTQIFWRERNNSFGVSINYIGILNNKK